MTIYYFVLLYLRTSAWPIGLLCCIGLVLFAIVASIVLALIPIYLPYHDSDLKYQSISKF